MHLGERRGQGLLAPTRSSSNSKACRAIDCARSGAERLLHDIPREDPLVVRAGAVRTPRTPETRGDVIEKRLSLHGVPFFLRAFAGLAMPL